jgi:radical SAM superfamily enzyme YgiQ (UPF0313 family)
MRVLLIMPDAQMHKLTLGRSVRSLREAPLTLATLAALGRGPDLEPCYTLVDESVDPVPLDHPADLVGISVLTGTARRAYALAQHFRSRGIPVVLGGVHVTLRPQEASAHADSVVLGMAERSWPQLLRDAAAGRLRRRYEDRAADAGPWIEGLPTPRWDLQRRSGYVVPHVVQATRGCRHACDFCSVPVVWRRFQRRPVAEVIRDIRRVPRRRFVISDVSPFDDPDYARELLRAMIPLGKRWGGLATASIGRDPELVDLLARSGCCYLLIGFESVNQQGLGRIGKGFNRCGEYARLVRMLHEARIVVQGCFVFGFDEDTTDVFPATVQQVDELRIDIPRYSIYTPYPGTRLYRRLEAEGRVLSYDWSDYDTMHVVFQPQRMTPVELYEGFRWAYRQTFRMPAILRRTLTSGRRAQITFFGNLAYRMFSRRLDRGRGFQLGVGCGQAAGLASSGRPAS